MQLEQTVSPALAVNVPGRHDAQAWLSAVAPTAVPAFPAAHLVQTLAPVMDANDPAVQF